MESTAEERSVTSQRRAGLTGPGAGTIRREGAQELKRRREGLEDPPASKVSHGDIFTDLMKKGYTQDEIFAVMLESEREKKRRRIKAIVIETVAAHRLEKMKELLAYEKLATWRRENGFDRIAADDNQWTNRPLPPTPEQFTQNLWCEVNALKDAISMPARTRPWQKTIEFVNGLKGKLPDEELAEIKRYVKKRSREAAQAHVTVTPVDTVQYCSPSSQTLEPPLNICVNLENNEGKMDPELKELKSSSTGTGFETSGQQCPPNEGTWETGRTTSAGFLTAAVGSYQGGNISSPATSAKMFADTSSTAATPENRWRKTPRSEQNKQFDPGGKGEKAPPSNAAVSLLFFFWGELGGFLLVLCAVCLVCACVFPNSCFLSR